MAEAPARCVDASQGVKVLSYDLLADDERSEVDAHLRACEACRDLKEQVFGDAGALRELDYRAFRMTQRQRVAASAWILQRVRDLWPPILVVVIVLVALLAWMARRGPESEPVQVMQLSTMQAASLDTTSAVPVPRLEPGLASVIVQPDRDAVVLAYEIGDGFLRRLVPGGDASPPVLEGRRLQEFELPELDSYDSRVLLVLAPVAATSYAVEAWDAAVLRRFGANEDGAPRTWPGDVVPTMRWLR